ncbi:GNAT family N-acetyltransferase [Variovorax saccharolyticus]|uniref:GNAT family N-acetyltransferase n=1 Tax=Variovorax saccharolyticus TaxID=3053516 RepID=UPI002577A059|nr:GNAT family N-acetyltransferase [Variovorax sp. J22R187]MDM0017907.1 GNAT family N-acetyltransferase [Variovorax sp. J22R187]
MASTESGPPAVETLAALDAGSLAMLDALVVASGWNQTADDWALFARHGSVHAVRDADGQIVASGAVLPLGASAAWISMILVAPGSRGLGLGRSVFEQCLRTVKAAGRIAMLDATPAGERLYLQYGFTPLWRLSRWHRGPVDGSAATAAARSDDTGFDALAALDAEALGLDRSAVLGELMRRADSRVVRHAQAFAVVRGGRIAHHVGPLVATDEVSAALLLRELTDGRTPALFVDVPDDRPLLRRQLAEAGFTLQRGFVRMAAGDAPARGQTAFIHAIAGPEYG